MPAKFPEAGKEQQGTETFFEDLQIQTQADPGGQDGRKAAGGDAGQEAFPGKGSCFAAQTGGKKRCGKEKQEIDASGGGVFHAQNHGEPEDQKAPAANAKSGEKAQDCGHNCGYRETF